MPDVAGPRRLRQLLDAVLTIGSDLDLPAMLRRIIQSAADLVDARYGALGVLDESGTRLSQFITVGLDDEQRARIGALPEGHGILGFLIRTASASRRTTRRCSPSSGSRSASATRCSATSTSPTRPRRGVHRRRRGAGGRPRRRRRRGDRERPAHTRIHELVLVEDRERIARDLHDTVIQRLFATGLSLQGSIRLIRTDPLGATDRVERAIDDLDLTSNHIRSAIFDLESSRPAAGGLRSSILEVVREAAGGLAFEPRVLFDGPVDSAVDDALGADVLAVVREALSNVVRHAHATRVDVSVSASSELEVRVRDDGVGVPMEVTGGHGTANLRARAQARGGTFELAGRQPTGTDLRWLVPLP